MKDHRFAFRIRVRKHAVKVVAWAIRKKWSRIAAKYFHTMYHVVHPDNWNEHGTLRLGKVSENALSIDIHIISPQPLALNTFSDAIQSTPLLGYQSQDLHPYIRIPYWS